MAGQVPGSAWRTLDGWVDSTTLHAAFVDGSAATVAHVVADLVPEQGPAPALDPTATPVGLAHARPGAVHEVSFPVYDLWFRPLEGFAGCPAHTGVFLVQPGSQTFSITLSTVVEGCPGPLQLSATHLPIEHHIDGPQVGCAGRTSGVTHRGGFSTTGRWRSPIWRWRPRSRPPTTRPS